jgi:low affinity Fe/Cu permease
MHDLFVRLARWASALVAHPLAFAGALLAVGLWAAAGPAFHYSSGWQLVINTGTTILTFLTVFLLQNMQNRDSRAMQIKLDELLRAVHGARTELVDLENVTEAELARYCEEFKTLHLHYAQLLSKRGGTIKAKAETAVFENGGTRATGARPAAKKTHPRQ